MMGISWGGFNGLQVAARRPPALKAIITLCSTDDRYADDIHFKGGCVINENLGWGGTMLAYSSRPPDPVLVGERWRAMWLERLAAEPFLAADWLRHPRRDAYWKHGSVCEDFGAIEAAVLAVGGWNDAYSNAVPRLIAGLRSPVKAIIGPWAHDYPHFAIPGPQIGFLQEALRWWDFWLKGEPTGVLRDPAVRYYLLDSTKPDNLPRTWPGRWLADGFWPGPGIERHILHLTDAGLRTAPRRAETPYRLLTRGHRPRRRRILHHLARPGIPRRPGARRSGLAHLRHRHPVRGASTLSALPRSSSNFAADKPVALLRRPPQRRLARRRGRPHHLHHQNLCHRDSDEFPTPLEPGRRYRIRIKLDDIAWRLPQGHRIRLALSTAYWPMMWPAPEPAELTVFTPESRLILPLRQPGPMIGRRCIFPSRSPPPPSRSRRSASPPIGATSRSIPTPVVWS